MTPNGTPSEPSGRAGIERAVALRYEPDSARAPRVIASGRGEIARKLVELAAEHGVPVHEDSELAALLALVELGDDIPIELFQAVAEVISFVCTVPSTHPATLSPRGPT
jgi:flagellar biosynthesis protein